MERIDTALGFALQIPVLPRAAETEGTLSSARAACAAVRDDLATWICDIPLPEPLPFAREQVLTMLAGTTVGGFRLEDEWQLINCARAWSRMLAWIEAGRFVLHSDVLVALNAILARDADLRWGLRQERVVPVGGVYRRRAETILSDPRFQSGVEVLERIGPTMQRAAGFFLFACLHHFVDVYNEATAWLMMNGVLLAGGLAPCRLPRERRAEWDMRMMRFYDQRDGDAFVAWFGDLYEQTLSGTASPDPGVGE